MVERKIIIPDSSTLHGYITYCCLSALPVRYFHPKPKPRKHLTGHVGHAPDVFRHLAASAAAPRGVLLHRRRRPCCRPAEHGEVHPDGKPVWAVPRRRRAQRLRDGAAAAVAQFLAGERSAALPRRRRYAALHRQRIYWHYLLHFFHSWMIPGFDELVFIWLRFERRPGNTSRSRMTKRTITIYVYVVESTIGNLSLYSK